MMKRKIKQIFHVFPSLPCLNFYFYSIDDNNIEILYDGDHLIILCFAYLVTEELKSGT